MRTHDVIALLVKRCRSEPVDIDKEAVELISPLRQS